MKKSFYLLFIISITIVSCFRKKEKEPILTCGTICDPETSITPAIFKAKCNTCHLFNKDGTGPKMEGVLNKIPNEKWLYSFLRNEDSLTQIKDPYTLNLQANFLLKNCHNDSSLTDLQIQEIIDYIKQ